VKVKKSLKFSSAQKLPSIVVKKKKASSSIRILVFLVPKFKMLVLGVVLG
jgi:hypothetical protein